ncbi:MAG: class III poly(R)-hydroxyalkanoic acid synthase subunit PhaC [Gammaproteobacteria bacterium]|nr:class III poly(R)-hydroxyalkanoic acid synthase subunit PhaC [Gammaproteobacteria bacterium]MCW5582722.1 class III poly(R)-hydroxyalkanoic acid synthase subunit PhaC [Gammaproteobacteria bacterium]
MQDDFIFLEKINQGLVEMTRIPGIQYEYNARELVSQCDKIKLYHYHPKIKKTDSIPLLVVFATVNRPEILDLFPEHSFIRGLLENGMDVYLLDWGYPSVEDQLISINDYVTRYLHHCVQFIIESTMQPKINLLGICQGGVLCLCYSVIFEYIKNLVLISTPIDFQTKDNVIGKIFKRLDVDTLVNLTGNIPGSWLTQFFISLRPFELVGKKYLRFIDHLSDHEWTDKFLRVEKWLYDAPDQTGTSFTGLVKDLYQQNKLIKGEMYLNHKRVDLTRLTIPILNIMAAEDEIVPMSATRALKKYVSSQTYTQRVFPSGHIGIYISDKVGNSMSLAISNWLKKHRL